MLVIYTAINSHETAEKLASDLVKGGLAARIDLLKGAESFTRKNEKLVRHQQQLLIISTLSAKESAVYAAVKAAAKDEVPPLWTLKPALAEDDFASWLVKAITGTGTKKRL